MAQKDILGRGGSRGIGGSRGRGHIVIAQPQRGRELGLVHTCQLRSNEGFAPSSGLRRCWYVYREMG